MIGATCALGAALAWAGGSTILKPLTTKIDTLSLNTIRLSFASLCLLAFIPLSGGSADFVHTPLLPIVYIIASGVIDTAIGGTIYIKSLLLLDVSRAYPIAMCSYPVFTMFLAIPFLEESFTRTTGVGAFLVVLGIYLLSATGKRSAASPISRKTSVKGIALAIIAAVAWAIGVVLLKKGAIGMDPFVAAAIRYPSTAIVLFLFTLSQRRKGTLQLKKYGSRSIALASTAGLIDFGMGGVLNIRAIQLIGAGKTTLLTSASPLFILPFAVLILKEKLTPYALAGIFVCIAGVYLVII